MKLCVLDTSVAVAWYVDESFSPAARRWQERLMQGEVTMIVPGLHYLEFANVLRTLVMRRELEPRLAGDIFDLHLKAPMETVEPDRKTLLATALAYKATAYDAAYISLCLSQNARLITAERLTTSWLTKLAGRVETLT